MLQKRSTTCLPVNRAGYHVDQLTRYAAFARGWVECNPSGLSGEGLRLGSELSKRGATRTTLYLDKRPENFCGGIYFFVLQSAVRSVWGTDGV
jgi:hypothetical protein